MENVYGLLGFPVEHSLSPLMHNDAFAYFGISARYHLFSVNPEQVGEAIAGVRALGIAGVNVTIPHKMAVIPFLDEVDEHARRIGAVNTIVNDSGRLIGYNTDGPGYVKALEEEMDIHLDGKRILLIGAGGGARGIYFSLLSTAAERIDIANRTAEKAARLIGEGDERRSTFFPLAEAERRLAEYDIIINTTSVGMHPHVDEQPLSLQQMRPGTVVSDIIYNPLETKWLKEAKARGARVQNGVGMLVYQGALAFEKWTGQWPDVNRMKQLVINQLRR
ncbi:MULTISPECIES: shikimate dehydrogenase [Geobacillus]|jgi:shikimate dehydrogenase|uniref:Shikimate dehydrogenase (NADP(+)) n=1 Tax=Geobacillus thermodenitrificans (strain NG80-2) TaxID=420246 RepID=A4IR51_GEOTN|nr:MULTISPECIES: shikimate dehydrogenase [Geobacillus]ABO67805.1 Shikimate 5-dehydrogenase [Geobacillus thermodenitrificans NG80-2]ATO38380.1 shikimate dehydrogenase [Geobacillus thermodenitrificans]KQB92372.1 Shikimate dehydrogenase [Geobacillus sp. PA-3]MED3717758.1 shikimate dehydrogenase [Geobacillus thermodenitrificans]MED3904439.1 shikimate dehydrogenase [Geobacillus thermodenitrificans]